MTAQTKTYLVTTRRGDEFTIPGVEKVIMSPSLRLEAGGETLAAFASWESVVVVPEPCSAGPFTTAYTSFSCPGCKR